jgi:hypothetical protein
MKRESEVTAVSGVPRSRLARRYVWNREYAKTIASPLRPAKSKFAISYEEQARKQ